MNSNLSDFITFYNEIQLLTSSFLKLLTIAGIKW